MTMTDEKYDRVEAAAVEVVQAMETPRGPDDATRWEWDDLDDVAKNRVRVALAEVYSRWEKQWESEANEGRRRLGKLKL